MNSRVVFLVGTCFTILSTGVVGYSFDFGSTPSQCGQLSISITGSGGTPPYRLGIVPWGSSSVDSGSREVRRIMNLEFNDSSSIAFTLPYPKNTQFIAIVSDKNGSDSNFASGGVTVPVTVTGSESDSCLPKDQVAPPFTFSTDPIGSIATCQQTSLTYSGNSGDVHFWGAVPGGSGFIINGQNTQADGKQALAWTPAISTGTGLVVVAGDSRGFGSGGSFQGFLQPGNGTTSCLNNDSPKTTPGSPAGGSYPTSTSGAGTGGSSDGGSSGGGSSKTNVGAIVGGVVGGVAGLTILALIILLLMRQRRKTNRRTSVQPVDLLEGRGHGGPSDSQHYAPGPYHIPSSHRAEEPEMSEANYPLTSSQGHRVSQSSLTRSHARPSTEEGSSFPGSSTVPTTIKSSEAQIKRPVNIVQHEDAGPQPQKDRTMDGEDTVELPPAYTNLRAR